MPACAACGGQNPDRARFCMACGTELGPPAPESRKVVTVLFADVAGSTEMGDRLDPEAFRLVMSRWFDEAASVVRVYGGVVEKFIGDAVMAVFGVPVAHEDDAMRAVRAACAIRDGLGPLAREIESRWGVALRVRIGVNTGEVVAGDPAAGQRLATGDAVNVAARLEQAAGPGDVLVGESTWRLVHASASGDPVDVEAKGKAGPLRARRLGSLAQADAPRGLEAPLVGRDRELEALRDAFDRSALERRPRLVTIAGPPGIGKSRLAAELVRTAAPSVVLRARCLPYGRSAALEPLAEAVRAVPGGPSAYVDDEAVRDRLESLADVPPREAVWAMRRLLAAAAAGGPVVLVVEDAQWAEAALLDLLEELARTAGAPALIVCTARPELLDERPSWDTPGVVRLGPLARADSAALVRERFGGVPGAVAERIADAAGGNPLFCEELAAMVVEQDAPSEGPLEVPPTVQAVLAARLDRLPAGERTVLAHAAVAGPRFDARAVRETLPADLRAHTEPLLAALVRRELIRADGDRCAFRHALVRDAAYGAMPKLLRATLHEEHAAWAERESGGDEAAGDHLERAWALRTELAPPGEAERVLARRAAERLGRAGRRAIDRADVTSAGRLLDRAMRLATPGDVVRGEILPDLAELAWLGGDLPRAERLLAEARVLATDTGDERLGARTTLGELYLRALTQPGSADEAETAVASAIRVLDAVSDDASLARAWGMLAWVHGYRGRLARATEARERGLVHAIRSGDRTQESILLGGLVLNLASGPTPAAEGLDRIESLLASGAADPWRRGTLLMYRAVVQAMVRRFEDAWRSFEDARGAFEEAGARVYAAATGQIAGFLGTLTGDLERAESEMRASCTELEALGERGILSTQAGMLAEVLARRGKSDEALEWSRRSEALGSPDDYATQVVWRVSRARALLDAGDAREAERLADEAVRIAWATDALMTTAGAFLRHAEALAALGRMDEARAEAERALELYERKGSLPSAATVRAWLAG